jgi:hypothetical protein
MLVLRAPTLVGLTCAIALTFLGCASPPAGPTTLVPEPLPNLPVACYAVEDLLTTVYDSEPLSIVMPAVPTEPEPARAELPDERLRMMIEQKVQDGEAWQHTVGRGVIRIDREKGLMYVRQTPEAQRKIEALLQQARDDRAIMINIEARFIETDPADTRRLSLYLIRQTDPSRPEPKDDDWKSLSGNCTRDASNFDVTLLNDRQTTAFRDEAIASATSAKTLFAPRLTLRNWQRAWVADNTMYIPPLTRVDKPGLQELVLLRMGFELDVKAAASTDRRYVQLDLPPLTCLSLVETTPAGSDDKSSEKATDAVPEGQLLIHPTRKQWEELRKKRQAFIAAGEAAKNAAAGKTPSLSEDERKQRVAALWQQANGLVEKYDYAGTVKVLDELLTIDPTNEKAWGYRSDYQYLATLAEQVNDKARTREPIIEVEETCSHYSKLYRNVPASWSTQGIIVDRASCDVVMPQPESAGAQITTTTKDGRIVPIRLPELRMTRLMTSVSVPDGNTLVLRMPICRERLVGVRAANRRGAAPGGLEPVWELVDPAAEPRKYLWILVKPTIIKEPEIVKDPASRGAPVAAPSPTGNR